MTRCVACVFTRIRYNGMPRECASVGRKAIPICVVDDCSDYTAYVINDNVSSGQIDPRYMPVLVTEESLALY